MDGPKGRRKRLFEHREPEAEKARSPKRTLVLHTCAVVSRETAERIKRDFRLNQLWPIVEKPIAAYSMYDARFTMSKPLPHMG